MKRLDEIDERGNINFSYVPVEKTKQINTQQSSRCCCNHLYIFFDLETYGIGSENGKKPLFYFRSKSDARNFGAIIRTAGARVNGIIVQKQVQHQ
jgi:tRNA G18 (ribose-2'-O)-methylase SpoU